MKTIYIPALLTGIENPIKRCLIPGNKFGLWNGYDPAWFTDLSVFQHPYVLVSYYYSGKIPNYRERLRIRPEVELWADSGGYSVFTQGAKINPIEVLRWQEKNSNVAFTLDVPPASSENVGRVYPGKVQYHVLDEFEKCAEQTRKNTLFFQENRNSDKLKIYNIVQGYNKQSLELWWDYVTNGIKLDGFGTGTKPTSNTLMQALCLMFLYSKGVRENVHLLGVSGITVIPLLVWVSQYIKKVTFDSTSYGYGSRTRAYMYPDKIREYTHFGKKYKTKIKPLTKLNCPCPICTTVKTVDYFLENDVTWPGLLLSLHNLWVTKKYVEDLERAILISKEEFFKLSKQHVGNHYESLLLSINFVEECISKGFDVTYNKYFVNHEAEKRRFKQRKLTSYV